MRTAGAAVAVIAAVIAGGWAMQQTALPKPADGQLVAVDAVHWLQRYRFAASTIHARGRTLHGRCYHGWFGARRSRLHGSLLVLDNGSRVAEMRLYGRIALGPLAGMQPLTALELAGCGEVLAPRLATLAIFGGRAGMRQAVLDGRPVLELRFRRLTLWVTPFSHRPVGAALFGATSRISLLRLTPETARAIRAAW